MAKITKSRDFLDKLEATYENCLVAGTMQGITEYITGSDYTNNSDFIYTTIEEKKIFYFCKIAEMFFSQFHDKHMVNEIMKKYCNNIIKISSINEFKKNPYVKDINFDECITDGNFKLESKKQKAFKLELLTEPQIEDFLKKKYLYTFFEEDYNYLCLYENNKPWMSIRPSEINSQQKNIENLQGNVLIFGLGLGYATYITALKENVTSVTVIEKNSSVINMFNKYIRPQFKTNTPINIIEGDAFKVFKDTDKMNLYDSCFIDINMGIIDGFPQYMFFKQNEEGIKYKIEYWMENSIKTFFKELIFLNFICIESDHINSNVLILARNTKNVYDNQCPESKPFVKAIEKYLYSKENELTINSIDDLYSLLVNDKVVDILLRSVGR